MCLKGITYDDFQKSRSEILNARQGDIKALAKLVEDCMNENNLCVFGNENIIKDNAEIFKTIKPAIK